MIKVLELFGGIGACTQAFKRLGIDYEVVDYVEIDKYAVASYNAINGTSFAPQDITQWDKDIEVDFIMHGSPCQDFSVAGLGRGGDENSGTRSSLMYESIRIINKLKPKYVLWENVKNLVSEKHRHNFDKYLMTLESLGYNNYYKVLNAKDYGIPQNRERVFTLSIRKDVDTNPWGYKFPKPIKLTKTLKDMLEDKVDEKYYLSSNMLSYLSGENQKESKFPRGERWLTQLETTNVKGVAATISTNAGNRPVDNFIIDDVEDESTDKSWLMENHGTVTATVVEDGVYTDLEKSLFTEDGNIKRYIDSDIVDEFKDGQLATTSFPNGYGHGTRVHNESTTLNVSEVPSVKNNLRIRKLTPKECWRLMGFSDEAFEKASKVNSNAQLYKQAGNSIVVNVLESILKELYNSSEPKLYTTSLF